AGSGGASSAVEARDASVPDVAVDTAPSRGPTQSTTGHKFPFPQNRESSRCVYPAGYRNEDVQAAYAQWKSDNVTSTGAKNYLRVQRPNEPGGNLQKGSTVSEGIGYGMLIAVYMDDQNLFDNLWMYEQQFLDGTTGLMNWYISADGSGPGTAADGTSGSGPATDADEDMAFALIMADKQWGGQLAMAGKNYIDIAKGQLTKVWDNEIFNYIYLKPGAWGDNTTINLSYFAPAYYKLFATVDTANATNWTNVVNTMYTVLNASLNSSNGNSSNGLVPAWCNSNGQPNGGAFGPGKTAPTNYQYDSCRTPFRIGLDYCWNGETRAKNYVANTSSFFSGIGATNMVDGYALNGNAQAQYQTGSTQSSAFVGPAGVGAMSNSNYQGFVNDAYGVLITGKALVGGTYYDDSWMVMSLLMMTANFLDYTAY
ncbi:MAG: glycosyl hydrolase family 8, partial [Polyangia bacterium]